MPLVALSCWAQTTQGPTLEEKFKLTQAVKDFYKAQQNLRDAQEQFTTKINTAAALAKELKDTIEKKYDCTYNISTDVCDPNPKKEVSQ